MTQLALRDHAFDDIVSGPVAPTTTADCSARSAKPAARIDLALVSTFEALETLEDEWNALHREVGKRAHAFQGFNWCWHWCRHYLGDGTTGPSLAIVTGRRAGRLVLVMPLVSQRKAGLVELTWLGEPVSQYGDVLASGDAATVRSLEAAWRFAVSQTGGDVANLRRVREDATASALLTHLGASVTATEEAPFLELSKDTSFAGWEERRQPRARKNRRRQERRFAGQGEIGFRALSGGNEAAALARHAVRLKRESLADKGAISLALADERFERFFSDAAHGCGRPAGVSVLALTSNGTPAALKIMIETDDTAFLHVAVFEPQHEKCGVGSLLLERLVERTILSGRNQLDLLPPRHTYKLDFADGSVMVRDYAIALSAKGWLYTQGFLRIRRRIKSAIEALPKPLRRAIGRLASPGGNRSAPAADHSAA